MFQGESEYIINIAAIIYVEKREENNTSNNNDMWPHIYLSLYSIVICRGVRAAGAMLPCEKTPKPLDSSNRVSCHPARKDKIIWQLPYDTGIIPFVATYCVSY